MRASQKAESTLRQDYSMRQSTIFFERYVTESETEQFPGDEVFFSTFPATEDDLNRIGRFPFKVTVACPYEKTEHGFVPFEQPHKVLLKAVHTLGAMKPPWQWYMDKDVPTPPTDEQRKWLKRYSTHRSKKFPVVVNIETALPPEAAMQKSLRLGVPDIVRLLGFCSSLSYKDPFLSEDKARLFPVDECRTFKPGPECFMWTILAYHRLDLLDKKYHEKKLEEIPFDKALRSVFKRLHEELKTYRDGKKFDAFTDYIFDLMKYLALKVSRATPVRICPICLHPIPEGSRPDKVYYSPPGYRLRRFDQEKRVAQIRKRLSQKTLQELCTIANKRGGIVYNSKTKKKELIKLIIKKRRPADYCLRASYNIRHTHPELKQESRAFLNALCEL